MAPSLMVLVAVLSAEPADVQRLDVNEAVQRALAQNPRLLGGREQSEAAADGARSVRGQFLPSLGVSEEFQHYDRPFAIEFPGLGAFNARDQNTNTLAVAAKQPLLGLVRIGYEYAAAAHARDAAAAQLKAGEQSLRESVETAYLRVFQARATRQLAEESQRQLAEQVTVGAARLAAGALTNADLLRLKVAEANAKQQQLQAKVDEAVSRTQLFGLIDLPLDSKVELVDPSTLEDAVAHSPMLADATTHAMANRPELRQAALSAEQAASNSMARFWSMFGDIDAEAAYLRIDGQAFAQVNAGYVGVKATIPLWTWGSQFYAKSAADHQAEAARLASIDAQKQVQVEVSSRIDQIAASTAAVSVAQESVSSAEEAFRVTNELVRAGSGTTTDLLDSQAALTQAKLNLLRARYSAAQSRVQLTRATGGD